MDNNYGNIKDPEWKTSSAYVRGAIDIDTSGPSKLSMLFTPFSVAAPAEYGRVEIELSPTDGDYDYDGTIEDAFPLEGSGNEIKYYQYERAAIRIKRKQEYPSKILTRANYGGDGEKQKLRLLLGDKQGTSAGKYQYIFNGGIEIYNGTAWELADAGWEPNDNSLDRILADDQATSNHEQYNIIRGSTDIGTTSLQLAQQLVYNSQEYKPVQLKETIVQEDVSVIAFEWTPDSTGLTTSDSSDYGTGTTGAGTGGTSGGGSTASSWADITGYVRENNNRIRVTKRWQLANQTKLGFENTNGNLGGSWQIKSSDNLVGRAGGSDLIRLKSGGSVEVPVSLSVLSGTVTNNWTVSGDLSVSNKFTVNTQKIFTVGNEQLLSTDASPTFAEVSIEGSDTEYKSINLTDTTSGEKWQISHRVGSQNNQLQYYYNDGTSWFKRLSLTTSGHLTLENAGATFNGGIEHSSYSTGFNGSNWGVNASGEAGFKSVTIRGALRAKEFIGQQTRALVNYTMAPAAGKIELIGSSTAGDEEIVLEDPQGNNLNPFAIDDIVIIQVVDIDDTNIVKKLVRRVDDRQINGLSQPNITLTTSGITWSTSDDVGSIEAGDYIVARGSTSDTNRDHYVDFDIVSTHAPSMRIFENIQDSTDLGDSSKEKTRVGYLDGFPDLSDGTTPSGYGLAGNNVYLDGTIVASSGRIGGWTLESDKQYADNSSGEVTGMQSGSGTTKTFFTGADDRNGTNAAFYAQADGNIFHDAIGSALFSRQVLASFGVDTQADKITNNEWGENITHSGTTSSKDRQTKVRLRYYHRFGIKNLIIQGKTKVVNSSRTGTWSREARVYADIQNTTIGDNILVTNNSYQDFTLKLDVSGLSNDTYYVLDVDLYIKVDGDSSNSSSDSTDDSIFLREDVYIQSAT